MGKKVFLMLTLLVICSSVSTALAVGTDVGNITQNNGEHALNEIPINGEMFGHSFDKYDSLLQDDYMLYEDSMSI